MYVQSGMGFELMTFGMPVIKVYAIYLHGIWDRTTDGCPNDILHVARRMLARDNESAHFMNEKSNEKTTSIAKLILLQQQMDLRYV